MPLTLRRYSLMTLLVCTALLACIAAIFGYWWRRPIPVFAIKCLNSANALVMIDDIPLAKAPALLTLEQMRQFAPDFDPQQELNNSSFEVHPAGRILGAKLGKLIWVQVPADEVGNYYFCQTPWGNAVTLMGSYVQRGEIGVTLHQRTEGWHVIPSWKLASSTTTAGVAVAARIELPQIFVDIPIEEWPSRSGVRFRLGTYDSRISSHVGGKIAESSLGSASAGPRIIEATFESPSSPGDYWVQCELLYKKSDGTETWLYSHDVLWLHVK